MNTAGAAGRVRGSRWVTKRTWGRCQGWGNLTKAGPGRPQPRLRGVWSEGCPGWGEASLLTLDLHSPGKRSLELVLLRPKAAGATLCHLPQPQGPHTGLSCPPRAGSIASDPAERRCPARLPRGSAAHIQRLCGEAWKGPGWPRPAAILTVPATNPGLAADGLFSIGSRLPGFQSRPSLHLLGAARVSGARFGVWTVAFEGDPLQLLQLISGQISPSLPMTQPGSGHTSAPPHPHPCRDLPWGRCHRRAPHLESSAGRCQVPITRLVPRNKPLPAARGFGRKVSSHPQDRETFKGKAVVQSSRKE